MRTHSANLSKIRCSVTSSTDLFFLNLFINAYFCSSCFFLLLCPTCLTFKVKIIYCWCTQCCYDQLFCGEIFITLHVPSLMHCCQLLNFLFKWNRLFVCFFSLLRLLKIDLRLFNVCSFSHPVSIPNDLDHMLWQNKKIKNKHKNEAACCKFSCKILLGKHYRHHHWHWQQWWWSDLMATHRKQISPMLFMASVWKMILRKLRSLLQS